jgi:hypothetical protein
MTAFRIQEWKLVGLRLEVRVSFGRPFEQAC